MQLTLGLGLCGVGISVGGGAGDDGGDDILLLLIF